MAIKKLKGAFTSKAVMFNVALLALLPAFEYLKDWLPELQPYVPAEVYQIVGIIVVVVNGAIHVAQKVTAALAAYEAATEAGDDAAA